MANIITFFRIPISIALFFTKPFAPVFYVLYICGGLTDMIDGTIARKTGSVSDFGSKLDTIADLVFFSACLTVLIPYLNFPVWVWVWVCLIGTFKIGCAIFRYSKKKSSIIIHNFINKITGLLLFIWPFTFSAINPKYTVLILCIISSFATIQDFNLLIKVNKYNNN